MLGLSCHKLCQHIFCHFEPSPPSNPPSDQQISALVLPLPLLCLTPPWSIQKYNSREVNFSKKVSKIPKYHIREAMFFYHDCPPPIPLSNCHQFKKSSSLFFCVKYCVFSQFHKILSRLKLFVFLKVGLYTDHWVLGLLLLTIKCFITLSAGLFWIFTA